MSTLIKVCFILFITTIVTACGGGGSSTATGNSSPSSSSLNSGNSQASSQASTSGGISNTRALTGSVSKGPVMNATVDIYTFNTNGTQGTFVIGGITTDAYGAWSANIPSTATGPFIIVATGGSYIDEYTGVTVSLGSVPLRGILPVGATSAAVTPITDAAVLTIQQMVTDGYASSPTTALSTVKTNYINSFGFDPISTIPPAPSQISGTTSADALKYMALLGGISTLSNDAYTQLSAGGNAPDRMAIVAQIAADFAADGSIDGYGNAAAPLSVNVGGSAQVLNGVFTGGTNLGTAVNTYQALPTAPASVAGATVTITPVDFKKTVFVKIPKILIASPTNGSAYTKDVAGFVAIPITVNISNFTLSNGAWNIILDGVVQTTYNFTTSTTLSRNLSVGSHTIKVQLTGPGKAYTALASQSTDTITINVKAAASSGSTSVTNGWGSSKGVPLLVKASGTYNVYVWQTTNPNIPIGNLTFTFSTDGTQGTVTDSTGTINVTTVEGTGTWGILGDLTDFFAEGFLSFIAGEYRFTFGAGHATAPGTFVTTFHDSGLIEGTYTNTAGQEVKFSNATSQYPLAAPAILTSKAGTYKANGYFFVSGPFEFSISNTGVIQYTDPTSCSIKTIAWDGNGDYVNANGTIQLLDPVTGHLISINTGLSTTPDFEFRIGASNSASIWRIDNTQPVGPVVANLVGNYGLAWCQARLNDTTPPVMLPPGDLYTSYPLNLDSKQWASTVTASSTWSSVYGNSYKTTYTIGAPDAVGYGDSLHVWSPVPNTTTSQWIQLDYATPVHASGISVYEANNNGFITQVDLIDTNGNPHTIWTGTDTTSPNVMAQFVLNFTPTTYLTKSIKIFTALKTTIAGGRAGVDAVELRGDSGIFNTGAPSSETSIQAYLNAVTATDTLILGSLVDTINVTNDAPVEFPFGTTTVTFTAVDNQGNTSTAVGHVIVTELDVLAPVITIPADLTVSATSNLGVASSDPYVQAFLNAATALDATDGIVAVAAVNVPTTLSFGGHTITFEATDAAGNTINQTAILTVADLTPPVITLLGAPSVQLTQGGTYSELGALATDNIDGSISHLIVIDSSAINTSVVGFYNVTYNISDSHGNTTQVTRSVEVTAPVAFNPVLAHPSPTTQNFNDVVFANNQFIAIGDAGTILSSVDGYSSWTSQTSGVTDNLLSICFDGASFWAVGNDSAASQPLVLSSNDGIAWVKQSVVPTWTSFNHITCGANGLLATTPTSTNYHSVDGINWAQVSPTQTMTQTYWDINSARYIGWGRASFNDITQVSTDGINWVNINVVANPGLDMIWDGTQYFGVGYSNTPFWHGFYTTSVDLYSYTTTASTIGILAKNITFTGVNYLALDVDGNMSISSNQTSWVQDPLFGNIAGQAKIRAISFNNNTVVAVGDAGEIFSSPNNLTLNWTKHKVQLTTNELLQSAYDDINGITVVVGKAGTILRSTDLALWTLETSGTINDLLSITWTGTQFVAVGAQGTILTSMDGISWNIQTSGTTLILNSVVSSGSSIIAKSGFSTLSSTNGVNWSTVDTKAATISAVTHLLWDGTQFILTTGYDTWNSVDGLTWQTLVVTASAASGGLADVIWDGSQYWAISNNSGALFKSVDALSWVFTNTVGTAIPTSLLWDITTAKFIFTGVSGSSFGTAFDTLGTSVDATNWTSRLKSPTLNHIAKSGTQFVMVGPNGTILVSP